MMKVVGYLETRREQLLAEVRDNEDTAARMEENARQYRRKAAEWREEAAEIEAAILSLQCAPKPVVEPAVSLLSEADHKELAEYAAKGYGKPQDFEEVLAVAEKKFKAGKKVA